MTTFVEQKLYEIQTSQQQAVENTTDIATDDDHDDDDESLMPVAAIALAVVVGESSVFYRYLEDCVVLTNILTLLLGGIVVSINILTLFGAILTVVFAAQAALSFLSEARQVLIRKTAHWVIQAPRWRIPVFTMQR